ncbi:nitroreductase/quinone reductase family protein [uncultured Jatrophihabitans sp.]|uniref:nitroreductase/quinone reductase family protein n=1 Tax=uncultured Jatrophihabitans sp. TaxID=1610747 RepID=UPI0035C973A1
MSTSSDSNSRNIEEFRANHGRLGGSFAGAPVLLLHTRGRKASFCSDSGVR